MSILDYVKPTLAPNVWEEDDKGVTLRPEIEKQILDTLGSAFKKLGSEMDDFVASIYIIGGITSRQWTDKSDIDVTVVVRKDMSDKAYGAIREYVVNNLNGEVAADTQHPVNYYFKKEHKFVPDVAQAIYDVKERRWLYKDERGEEFDPEAKYQDKLVAAEEMAEDVVSLVEALKRDLIDLGELKQAKKDSEFYAVVYSEKLGEVWADVENLERIYSQIHAEREKAFAEDPKGANESTANIIYKYLEKYGYLDELKDVLAGQDKFLKGLSGVVGLDLKEVLEPKPRIEEADAKDSPSFMDYRWDCTQCAWSDLQYPEMGQCPQCGAEVKKVRRGMNEVEKDEFVEVAPGFRVPLEMMRMYIDIIKVQRTNYTDARDLRRSNLHDKMTRWAMGDHYGLPESYYRADKNILPKGIYDQYTDVRIAIDRYATEHFASLDEAKTDGLISIGRGYKVPSEMMERYINLVETMMVFPRKVTGDTLEGLNKKRAILHTEMTEWAMRKKFGQHLDFGLGKLGDKYLMAYEEVRDAIDGYLDKQLPLAEGRDDEFVSVGQGYEIPMKLMKQYIELVKSQMSGDALSLERNRGELHDRLVVTAMKRKHGEQKFFKTVKGQSVFASKKWENIYNRVTRLVTDYTDEHFFPRADEAKRKLTAEQVVDKLVARVMAKSDPDIYSEIYKVVGYVLPDEVEKDLYELVSTRAGFGNYGKDVGDKFYEAWEKPLTETWDDRKWRGVLAEGPQIKEGQLEYHGTTPEKARSILSSGKFRVGRGQSGVSTTIDYQEALDYAEGNPDGVLVVAIRPGAEMVGKEGVDFLTGTGSWSPEDVRPLGLAKAMGLTESKKVGRVLREAKEKGSPDYYLRWWIIGGKNVVPLAAPYQTHYEYVVSLPEKRAVAEFQISPETYRKLQLRVRDNVGIGDEAAADLFAHNVRLGLYNDELGIQSKDASESTFDMIRKMLPTGAKAAKRVSWETFSGYGRFTMDEFMSMSSAPKLKEEAGEMDEAKGRKYYELEELPKQVQDDARASIPDDFEVNVEAGDSLKWHYDVMLKKEIEGYGSDFIYRFGKEEANGEEMARLISDVEKNGIRQPPVIGPMGLEGNHRVYAAYVLNLPKIKVVRYAVVDKDNNVLEESKENLQEAPVTSSEAFKKWFGKSKVVDGKGNPLVVYRGEHGKTKKQFQTHLGSLSFGTAKSASVYATDPNQAGDEPHSPRVSPVYLRIEKPIVDTDDPFIGLATIKERLGPQEARRIAIKFAADIENTNNWQDEINGEGQYESVLDFINKNPKELGKLYFDIYLLLDDPKEVAKLKREHFDGAICGGSGETFDEKEYRVFDIKQVKSAIGNKGTFDPNSSDINEDDSGDYSSFGSLTRKDLVDIAKWGLTGEYSDSGAWDYVGWDKKQLDKVAEYQVDTDFKEALNTSFPQGLKGLSDPVRLYRYVALRNPSELNKEHLGRYWFATNKASSAQDFFSELEHLTNKVMAKKGQKLYKIVADIPHNRIDIPRTLWQRSTQGHENEFTLKDDTNLGFVELVDAGTGAALHEGDFQDSGIIQKADVREKIYHQSSAVQRGKILAQGLIPRKGSHLLRGKDYDPAIYFYNLPLDSVLRDWMHTSNFDLWEIDTKGLKNKFYYDGNYDEAFAIMSYEPIPAKNIKLIYKSGRIVEHLVEAAGPKVTSFDLSDTQIKELAVKFGQGFNGPDDAEQYLRDLLTNKFPFGYKDIPNQFKLYRVVWAKSAAKVNKKKVGTHYIMNAEDIEDIVEKLWAEHSSDETPFVLTVKANREDIDIPETIYNNLLYPYEYEITLKEKAMPEVVKVTPSSITEAKDEPKGLLRIAKSKNADTRSCDYANVSIEELEKSSKQHINDIDLAMQYFAKLLGAAASEHDADKLTGIKHFHSDFIGGFKETGWLENHYKVVRHHLSRKSGRVPEDVNLIDVLEYIADNVMAGMGRSGEVREMDITPEDLQAAFKNTVKLLKDQVVVYDNLSDIKEEDDDKDKLREMLANYAHKAWAGWIKYQFGKCTRNEDGSLVIPAEHVARWERQVDTPYDKLSGPEQDSDRKEADKMIALFKRHKESAKLTEGDSESEAKRFNMLAKSSGQPLRIVVRNKVYSANDEPIVVEVPEWFKALIGNMSPDHHLFYAGPDTTKQKDRVEEFYQAKKILALASGSLVKEEEEVAQDKITPEMQSWFEQRTNRHISLVQKYCKLIAASDLIRFKDLIARGREHDRSKLQEPERTPYVHVTWHYKMKDAGKEYKVPDELLGKMNDATLHHVQHNPHHPEYYSGSRDDINRNDRDKPPAVAIDATKMTDLDIAEMVADWLAMGEEKGTKAKAWADKNIGARWKFTPEQTELIYKLIALAG